MTAVEAELLHEGLAALTATVRDEIRERLARMTGPPYICPFMDDASGACMVYKHHPLACHTYGFYVERDQGLYCGIILERVEQGDFSDAVWGNACAINDRAQTLGTVISIERLTV